MAEEELEEVVKQAGDVDGDGGACVWFVLVARCACAKKSETEHARDRVRERGQ